MTAKIIQYRNKKDTTLAITKIPNYYRKTFNIFFLFHISDFFPSKLIKNQLKLPHQL